MRVAAYQAPYLPFGSMEAIELIRRQLAECEARDVDILCCPEAVIGGLAHESDGQSPYDVAIQADNGELAEVVAPLLDTAVSVVVGFTERDASGRHFSSAALLDGGRVAGVYRKVYPGYRTVIQAGESLPVFRRGSTAFGIIVCNDIWYVEPARIIAEAGAALLFVPTNSGHLKSPSTSLRARARNLPIARAVENSITVVAADIAGRQGDRLACGSSAIVDPDGIVLAQAGSSGDQLVIADVEPQRRRARDPRGWDGANNPAVTDAFLRLWRR
ncbi:carbon-nitrogen hydrolase family protein [Actinopolymorpha alba]|uniref:carbon-nitrogen hydrolase family protein n=1 Tax=Actinopolymorpha alba TaxID=533267 RepID=UPI0012F655DB|nr:carbon-nitrogen hydrolase family protein [Actinopolymorpha alba]